MLTETPAGKEYFVLESKEVGEGPGVKLIIGERGKVFQEATINYDTKNTPVSVTMREQGGKQVTIKSPEIAEQFFIEKAKEESFDNDFFEETYIEFVGTEAVEVLKTPKTQPGKQKETTKTKKDAIQKTITEEGVLRREETKPEEQVGLREVGEVPKEKVTDEVTEEVEAKAPAKKKTLKEVIEEKKKGKKEVAEEPPKAEKPVEAKKEVEPVEEGTFSIHGTFAGWSVLQGENVGEQAGRGSLSYGEHKYNVSTEGNKKIFTRSNHKRDATGRAGHLSVSLILPAGTKKTIEDVKGILDAKYKEVTANVPKDTGYGAKEGDIIDDYKIEDVEPNMGVLKYGNTYLNKSGIKEGDLVSFPTRSKWEFIVDNELLYCMKSKNIISTHEYEGNETEYNPSWA